MENVREEIHKGLQSMKGKMSPRDMKRHEELLIKVIEEGKPVHEAMGISKNSIEFLYAQAYNLFQSGKYAEAKQIFYILNFLDPKDTRFIYSIAACLHRQKDYTTALVIYLGSLGRDPANPILYWHISDCYVHLDKKVAALLMLRRCVRCASEDANFESLKTRAEQEEKTLAEELGEKPMGPLPKNEVKKR